MVQNTPQQQQQQHSLFSQASWGRLEMKPKRNKGHGSGTLIASLQALLSKAISLEIFQSLRSNGSEYSLHFYLHVSIRFFLSQIWLTLTKSIEK